MPSFILITLLVPASKYTFDSPPLARNIDSSGDWFVQKPLSFAYCFKNSACSSFEIALLSKSVLTVVLVLKLPHKRFLIAVQ